MISKGKSNLDVIDELLEMMSKGDKITLNDIDEIISTRSIVDTKASSDSLTIFYSGEPENLINTIATGGSEIRMIRRTEAFEFVANDNLEDIVKYAIKGENPSWTADQIKDEVRRLFYEASEYDSAGNLIKKGQGYWTEISRRFAADTKGDAYSLCANADPTRIYAADELPTWLDVADDSAKMRGYTKADLLAMNKTDRFNAIKEWTTKDLESSKVFYNDLGEKIGQTFDGTLLENKANNIIPHDYKFETTMGDIRNYISDAEMSKLFPDVNFENLSELEKLQIRQLELEYRRANGILDIDKLFITNIVKLLYK